MTDLHAGFQELDASTLPDRVSFLNQVDALGDIVAIKSYMRYSLGLRPGQHVVDVGCGMGHELTRLGTAVGPAGIVVGVDLSPDMALRARERTARIPGSATVSVGDAQQLPLPDGWADAARTERVLMYVDNAEQAIRELVRITRPGGRVCVFELDYGATLVDVPDQEVAENVLRVLAATIRHRWMGRSLGRLFRAAGLENIAAVPFPIRLPYLLHQMLVRPALEAAVANGSLSEASYQTWLEAGRDAARAGHHTDAFIGIVASGTRPS
jgi:ubiquinone/menaquinone biosynthesis C-methylase UbiE